MSSKLLTRDEFKTWCKEIADDCNAVLDTMTPKERKEAITKINEYARIIGGFPEEEK